MISTHLQPQTKETFAKAVLDDDDDGIIIIGLDASTSTLVQAFATEIIDPDGDGLTNAKEDELDTDPDDAQPTLVKSQRKSSIQTMTASRPNLKQPTSLIPQLPTVLTLSF